MQRPIPPRSSAVLAVLVLLLTALAGPAAAETWEGEWRTFWRTGQALMILQQDGERVSGTYRPGGGLIEGTAKDGVLTGTWSQPGSSGGFEFALSPDGGSFSGRFDNGEYWNGERIVEDVFTRAPFHAADTPRAALRTIVVAGNAMNEGDAAASLILEPLLVYEGDTQPDAAERMRRDTLLYRLIDMSTFRIADVPAAAEDGSVTFAIGPAGSDFEFPLELLQDGEGGDWRLVVPTMSELEAVKESMLEAVDARDYAEFIFNRRHSPRQTMRDFLAGVKTWGDGGAELAMSTMDLSGVPEALISINAPLYADYLRQIIDRLGYVVWQEIPNDPDQVNDYVFYRHAAGDITIGRQMDADGNVDWRFTEETLEAAPAIYEAIQPLPIAAGLDEPEPFSRYFALREWVKDISPRLVERGWLLAHWQWIAIAVALAASLAIAWIVGRVVKLVWHVLPEVLVGDSAAADRRRDGFVNGVRLIVVGFLLYGVFGRIGLRTDVLSVLATGAALVMLVGTVVVLYRIAGIIGNAFYRQAEKRGGVVDEIVSSLATGIVKVAIVVGGIILGADIVGLPYEGVIAGIGVGGLALAIAARDTVSNFFGAAVLLADRPFRRGDFVQVDGQYAIVEEVGLRSSRLRLFSDALMVIPNGKIADNTVINFGRRRKRQILLTLSLTWSTPRERIDAFSEKLRALLRDFPRADAEFYVGLARFAPSAVEIDIWCYVWVGSYGDQVAAQHKLVGDIMALADDMGIDFAYPARTVHMAGERAIGGGAVETGDGSRNAAE